AAYAGTILDLAANFTSPTPLPGLIGFFSSTRLLKLRIARLVRTVSVRTLRVPLCAGLVLIVGLLGLTDRMSALTAEEAIDAKQGEVISVDEAPAGHYAITGQCIDFEDRSPLSDVTLK